MAKIVFFGTPDYVIPVLEALKEAGHVITAVITQPAKPVGRRQKVTPSPVAQWAERHNILVVKDSTLLCRSVENSEVGILASYGQILSPGVLQLFPRGILNTHPSLLPKYRGASPVAAAIAAGDRQTGVTIFRLDEELDHGPILSQFTEDIKPTDTLGTLRERLFKKSAEVLVEILPAYLEGPPAGRAGRIKLREQDHSKASYTTLIKKEHGFIPPRYVEAALKGVALKKERWEIGFIKDYTLHHSPATLHNFIRALDPWPGAWTEVKLGSRQQGIGTRRLKILKAHLELLVPSAQCLVPDLVQLEGKKPVSWQQFRQGYPEAKF